MYKNSFKNQGSKVMSKVIFWIGCLHGIWVSHGIHHTPRSNHWRLSICPTVTRFVFRRGINQCQVFVASTWHLASHRCLLQIACQPDVSRGGNYWAPQSQPDLWLVTALWTTVPAVSVSHPVIFIFLDPLTSTQLASSLQQTPIWSKLSPLVCRHLTLICSMRICKF
jgi:hypothetical protein